ncbi:MAG: hypothetical protein ACT4P1_05735 [Sporichthyaceae bacterium]
MSTTELAAVVSGPECAPPDATVERGAARPGMIVAAGLGVGVLLLSTIALSVGGGDGPAASRATATQTPVEGEAAPQVLSASADPAAGAKCRLLVEGKEMGLSGEAARTLTMVAAVGLQVGAPAESSARVLDMAGARSSFAPRVTDALQLFAKGDTKAPTGPSLASVRALGNPQALSCTHTMPMAKDESRDSNGLTPRADTLRKGIVDAFGGTKITGFGSSGKGKDAALPRGRAMRVKVSPSDNTERGWVIAHWLTAHAASYRVYTVGFDGRDWTNRDGWRTSGSARANTPGQVYVSVVNGVSPEPQVKGANKKSKSDEKSAKDSKKSR